MSSILSSEVLSDRPQADGRRYVRMVFHAEDNNSGMQDVFIGPKLVASDFNATIWMAAHEADVLEGLAREEDEGGKDMHNVADSLVYALNPKWSTTKRIAKAQVYWMMEEKDVRIVLYLEPLIEYIQVNYNATQIANLLDITITKVQRMNRRINAILSDIGTCKALISDFDVEEGEF